MFMQLFKFLVSGHLKYAKTVWWGAICLMFFGQNVPKPLSEHDTSTDITPVHVVNKPNSTMKQAMAVLKTNKRWLCLSAVMSQGVLVNLLSCTGVTYLSRVL